VAYKRLKVSTDYYSDRNHGTQKFRFLLTMAETTSIY